MNTTLRDSLINQADDAFFTLADQVNDLLDAAQIYSDNHPVITKSDMVRTSELNTAVKDMGQLLRQVAGEIARWKNEEERVISQMGVELEYLNELRVTIEATLLFFIFQNITLSRFTLDIANRAHADLVRCNRLL